MQNTAINVHLIELQPAGFRDAQPVPEHQEQKATVAGLVAAAPDGFKETFNLAPGEVLRSLPPPAVMAAPGQCFRRPYFAFCPASTFCRKFPRAEGPETLINRGAQKSTFDKWIHLSKVCVVPKLRCPISPK
jgi:hypothetical protein